MSAELDFIGYMERIYLATKGVRGPRGAGEVKRRS